MPRIGLALAVWIVAVLLLWLGGGMGLRSSAVLSLIIALVLDQVILVDKVLSESKGGVRQLGFDVDLASILLNLGIIGNSTDWEQIAALQEAPYATFPHFRTFCVLIPEANLLVWPSLQVFQSKINLNVAVRLPKGCPLAESVDRDIVSRYGEEHPDVLFGIERYPTVEFFIEDGCPECEFGLWVPKAFAEERIKTGGFGNACLDYREKERYGQFRLVLGRFPATLFRPHFPEYESFRRFTKRLRALGEFDKNLKKHFEGLGWALEDHKDHEYLPDDVEIAKHKYMQIEIFNRER